MGETSEARKCWRKALKVDPGNVTARQCLSTLTKESGKIRLEGRLWPKAFSGIRIKRLIWPAVVIILLGALIVTNLILLRRIDNLKAELAKAKAGQQVQVGEPASESTTEGPITEPLQAIRPPELETEA